MKQYGYIGLFIFMFVFYGCSSIVQVQLMEVQSTNCSSIEKFLEYENDTIRVVYIFWTENGTMGLFIHNKLKQPLYVDWKKCSYITSTIKHDYWDENVNIISAGSSTLYSENNYNSQSSTSGSSKSAFASNSKTEYWRNFWNPEVYSETKTEGEMMTRSTGTTLSSSSNQFLQSTFNSSLTRIIKPERITFIPPGATVSQAMYPIVSDLYYFQLDHSLTKDTSLLIPRYASTYRSGYYDYNDCVAKKITIFIKEYKPSTSPVSFRSFVTYSTDEKFSSEAYIDNYFYVSRIVQIPKAAFRARIIGAQTSEDNNNIWAAPNSFYVFIEPE